MRVVIVGLNKDELARDIKKHHKKISLVRAKPEFVICYGGDGTLLYAERHWSQIPKVMIRHSQVCSKCSEETQTKILQHLERGEFYIKEQILLEAKINERKIIGLNDIFVGHRFVNTALRFRIWLNNQPYGGEIFGDAVVVSTPLGSTGYYQSITRSNFENGLGIAFSNAINFVGHLVVSDDTIIKVAITRGPGVVTHDNDQNFHVVSVEDKIVIQKSSKYARIVVLEGAGAKYNIGISQTRVPLGFCQICHKKYCQ